MRTARLVGLSPDGRSLIVATENGEEMTIVADDRLRAALRGDRARLGQLEIEMESALSPRDIQTRIRSGESLEDVTRAAGIPLDRVERFASPVLAEREHIAGLAMASSVRRRGETSGHRNLRVALTERLLGRGVDIDTVHWDSYRTEGGRWAVTADYRSGEAARQATFVFDVAGRFSVADNDEARWVLGEHTPVKGPQPGRRRGAAPDDDPDTEPTLDLSDELALVRVVQGDPRPVAGSDEPVGATVRDLHPRATVEPEPGSGSEPDDDVLDDDAIEGGEPIEVDAGEDDPTDDLPVTAPGSQLDNLIEMLDGDGYAEDSVRIYAGLADLGPSDASAVPETTAGGWEPAMTVSYPVEPARMEGLQPGTDEASDHVTVGVEATLPDQMPGVQPIGEPPSEPIPGEGAPPGSPVEAPPVEVPPSQPAPVEVPESEPLTAPAPESGAHQSGAPADPTAVENPRNEEDEFELVAPPTPVSKPVKRKRASVPSWDEIMFGGPKRPS